MAGIIAGNDDPGGEYTKGEAFTGVAPDARILSVKVADAEGATDVSQVLAAIDWVVQHRDDHGLHVRVINLSFGTDSVQSDALDPLVHAVEVAWRAGIVVVAAAGNRGSASSGLDDPARSPHVIAVGADDTNGTASTADDSIPGWSSAGDGSRNPDLVAPGKSVTSLRDPGSYIDQQHADARVDARYFRGSGTSTSTAVVSGVVALLLQQRPNLTPDQVKAVLTAGARPVPSALDGRQGAGLVNARDASRQLALMTVPAASDDTGADAGVRDERPGARARRPHRGRRRRGRAPRIPRVAHAAAGDRRADRRHTARGARRALVHGPDAAGRPGGDGRDR